MAPHSMETILRPPQWPPAFSNFVTQCLMWDPKSRPTSFEALRHEYFTDAVDPLRPKSSRLLNKNKHVSVDSKAQKDSDIPGLTSHRSSWFRKSVVRDPSPAVVQPNVAAKPPASPRPPAVHAKTTSIDAAPEPTNPSKYRPFGNKRATWTNGTATTNAAPMPILPSIRPISPFSNTITAQAHNNQAHSSQAQSPVAPAAPENKPSKKIGRQLSIHSNGNHYAEIHRQETERALNGQSGIASPTSEQKEGFFSHLRKRARRLSGKPHIPVTPAADDIEATAGCSPWQSNRNSMMLDSNGMSNMDTILEKSLDTVDQKLQTQTQTPAKLPLSPSPSPEAPSSHKFMSDLQTPVKVSDRHPPLSKSASTPSFDSPAMNGAAVSTRTRRAVNRSSQQHYDTPDEQDELLHEALASAHTAARRMDRVQRVPAQPQEQAPPVSTTYNPYPTPSPSAKRNGMLFDQSIMADPLTPSNVSKPRPKELPSHRWPTPPYEDNEWAASVFAAASSAAAGSVHQ